MRNEETTWHFTFVVHKDNPTKVPLSKAGNRGEEIVEMNISLLLKLDNRQKHNSHEVLLETISICMGKKNYNCQYIELVNITHTHTHTHTIVGIPCFCSGLTGRLCLCF